MKRNIFFCCLFLLFNVYLSAQTENQVPSNEELELRGKQVKEICGVAFGEKQEVALDILKHKYGEPYIITHNNIVYHGIGYGGVSFENILFGFQYDGKRSYMNSCSFLGTEEDISYVTVDFNNLLKKLKKKYDLGASVKDYFWIGGISPLWDGHIESLSGHYYPAIVLDIKKNENGKSFVRLMYGQEQLCPFEYVSEDF